MSTKLAINVITGWSGITAGTTRAELHVFDTKKLAMTATGFNNDNTIDIEEYAMRTLPASTAYSGDRGIIGTWTERRLVVPENTVFVYTYFANMRGSKVTMTFPFVATNEADCITMSYPVLSDRTSSLLQLHLTGNIRLLAYTEYTALCKYYLGELQKESSTAVLPNIISRCSDMYHMNCEDPETDDLLPNTFKKIVERLAVGSSSVFSRFHMGALRNVDIQKVAPAPVKAKPTRKIIKKKDGKRQNSIATVNRKIRIR